MKELPQSPHEASPDEASKLLRESDARYNLLVDSVKDYAIFMLDSKGFITTWNTGAANIKGYTKEEIIGKHFSIFYTREALDRNHPQYELEVAQKEGSFEEEGWRLKKDGSMFWANVVISAIWSPQKELIGFSKVTRDLSERKKLQEQLLSAHEELKESEERQRLLIESVKDYAIFLLTPEGNIATWNEGAKRIKGYETDEILGCHFSKFYLQEAVEGQYPQFELMRALKDGRFEDEGWRVKKDGSRFWANVVITPVVNASGKHLGFTKITRDLSERVRNENLTKKNMDLHRLNTDLDNFVYTASHDLRAPITNLEGLLSLMEIKIGPKVDEDERKLIRLMRTSILKLNNTIESLVEVTKAQKNQDAARELVSFKEVLDDVKEEITTLISESGAEIQATFNSKEISFTKAGIKSIIYNLLSNAIKYRAPERTPQIAIRTYREKDKTILSIKDNGLGLSKQQQARLFSMFRRFHSHVEGTGIGLYIVKRTMENNGGKIKVNSKLNEGTEFKLYFNS